MFVVFSVFVRQYSCPTRHLCDQYKSRYVSVMFILLRSGSACYPALVRFNVASRAHAPCLIWPYCECSSRTHLITPPPTFPLIYVSSIPTHSAYSPYYMPTVRIHPPPRRPRRLHWNDICRNAVRACIWQARLPYPVLLTIAPRCAHCVRTRALGEPPQIRVPSFDNAPLCFFCFYPLLSLLIVFHSIFETYCCAPIGIQRRMDGLVTCAQECTRAFI